MNHKFVKEICLRPTLIYMFVCSVDTFPNRMDCLKTRLKWDARRYIGINHMFRPRINGYYEAIECGALQ